MISSFTESVVEEATGVGVRESKGRLIADSGHIMGFLEVLDRRRYDLEPVKGSPERFQASSRRKIKS